MGPNQYIGGIARLDEANSHGSAVRLARIFHQERARVGCDAVRWQGATTLRARARKEEQRGKQAAARRNRVRSARYKLDLALETNKVSIHAALRGIAERPGEICGLALRPNDGVRTGVFCVDTPELDALFLAFW